MLDEVVPSGKSQVRKSTRVRICKQRGCYEEIVKKNDMYNNNLKKRDE